jgi:hypothetical protein
LESPGPGDKFGESRENNPWSAPAAALTPFATRPSYRWFVAAAEGVAVGIIMGLVDINWAYTGPDTGISLTYFGVALVLGLRHGIWGWLAWLPLGICLYVIHLIAIAHGYKQPYVEANAEKAIGCLVLLGPSGLGIGIGAILQWGVKFLIKHGSHGASGKSDDGGPDLT